MGFDFLVPRLLQIILFGNGDNRDVHFVLGRHSRAFDQGNSSGVAPRILGWRTSLQDFSGLALSFPFRLLAELLNSN